METDALQQVSELLHRQFCFSEDPQENFWLEGLTGMKGNDDLFPLSLSVAECDMTSHLVIVVPTGSNKGANQPIPGHIPGELTHTVTSTVTSSSAVSSGIGSPCLRQLSR